MEDRLDLEKDIFNLVLFKAGSSLGSRQPLQIVFSKNQWMCRVTFHSYTRMFKGSRFLCSVLNNKSYIINIDTVSKGRGSIL